MEEDLLVSKLTSKNRAGDKKISVDQLPQCCIKRTTASKKRLDHQVQAYIAHHAC